MATDKCYLFLYISETKHIAKKINNGFTVTSTSKKKTVLPYPLTKRSVNILCPLESSCRQSFREHHDHLQIFASVISANGQPTLVVSRNVENITTCSWRLKGEDNLIF
jgi:hypothetical protein